MTELQEIGQSGEVAAGAFLATLGYEVLETNWRVGQMEVDIIAKKGDILVFVEVKTRRQNSLVSPAQAVGKNMQKTLIRAASSYIKQKRVTSEVRFDIITVLSEDFTVTEHIEAAYRSYGK